MLASHFFARLLVGRDPVAAFYALVARTLDFVSFTLPRDENVADQQLLLPICWAGLGWLSSDASRRLWPGLLLVALSASSHGTYHSVGGRGWRWIRTIERLRWAGGHRGLVPWSCFAAFASGSEYGKFVLATLSVTLTFECQKSPGNTKER